MTTRIKLRRDTAVNWASANPILALGEAGYDITNNQIRIGNGISTWSLLSPIGGTGGSDIITGLTLTGNIPYANGDIVGEPISFTRANNSENTVDAIDTGLTLKRNNNDSSIHNSLSEIGNIDEVSPLGTEWNVDGWGDLTDVQTRRYTTFYNACDGNIPANVVHKEFVMHDTTNDKYYKIDFNWWQPNAGGSGLNNKSGFSYTRSLIDTTKVTYFVRTADDETAGDVIDTGLTIKRGVNGGIYNSIVDTGGWDPDVTPSGTLWNDDGWDNFSDIGTRVWKPLYSAVHGDLGEHLVGRELIMWDTIHDKYYIVKFTEWGQNNGGSFAYYRREINPSLATKSGIVFADGTVQRTAYASVDIKIKNNEISLANNKDLNITTFADPLVDSDINITAADDLWLKADGDMAEISAANTVRIVSGGRDLIECFVGTPSWNGANVIISDHNTDTERSLQLYMNSTYNVWFRTDAGKWYKTASSDPATLDTGTYTIPVEITNTGAPITITDMLLRDPDWNDSTVWEFRRNGVLVLPVLNTTTPFGSDNDPTLRLGVPSDNVVITNAPTNADYRGGYGIRVQGQQGYGTWNTAGTGGMGTEVYIQAGSGGESTTASQGGEGGGVYLFGGHGQNAGKGGQVRIKAGDTMFLDGAGPVHAGDVFIEGGSAPFSNGIANGAGIAGSVYLDTGTTGSLGTQGEIQFRTSTNGSSLNNVWKFKNDGATQFPTLTVPISDNTNPNGTGQTLKFNDPTQQAIIYGPPSTVGLPNADRIIIQGAPGFTGTAGEGGDVYLWAGPGGDTNGNGGDIKVRAGRGFGTGSGGYLNFQAGDSGTGTGGYINIESGESSVPGSGGDITVIARGGGQITLSTYGNTYHGWTFDPDGKTTLPGAVTIPGAVVKGTAIKTAVAIGDVGKGIASTVTASPTNNTNLTVGTVNNVYFGTGFALNITVASNGDISATVASSDNLQEVGSYGTILGGALGGTTGVDDVTFTVASITSPLARTAIDLTKPINRLGTGAYSLADGVEGQIMYLVPENGTDGSATEVVIANVRRLNTTTYQLYTDISWAPFETATNTGISMLIFTGGAWQIGRTLDS